MRLVYVVSVLWVSFHRLQRFYITGRMGRVTNTVKRVWINMSGTYLFELRGIVFYQCYSNWGNRGQELVVVCILFPTAGHNAKVLEIL